MIKKVITCDTCGVKVGEMLPPKRSDLLPVRKLVYNENVYRPIGRKWYCQKCGVEANK